MSDLPPEAVSDPMRPPKTPVLVHCIHCGSEYESYLIEWREQAGHRESGGPAGFWVCPIPGCSGAGFKFDIFPVDPDYVDEETGEKLCFDEENDHEEDCDRLECEMFNEELDAMEAELDRRGAVGELPPLPSQPPRSDAGEDGDIPF